MPDDYNLELHGDARPRVRIDVGRAIFIVVAFLLLVALLGAPLFVWTFCRIQVGKGQFVPLLRKTGKDITNEMILAPSAEFKGPQYQILKEGRHFRNPYTWWWPDPIAAMVIEKGQVGVLVRKYGAPIEPEQIVAAKEDDKGIVPTVLLPGRHYINTWAYDVAVHDMVRIEPGHMGVVTLLVGAAPKNPNTFVVAEGERGTQPYLLPPGTHPKYSNPYIYMVTPIDTRSQKFEMSGEYQVTFPSLYGFDIIVEGTIEWAPDIDKLPELFVKYVDEKDLQASGGIDNIQRKIILTFARSFFRTVGGRHKAVDYIIGDARIRVQQDVEARLREACAEEGVLIKSFVIRSTEPPAEIREQYARREMARREIDRFQKEIETQIGSVVREGGKAKLDANGKPVLENGNPVIVGGKQQLDAKGRPVRRGGRLEKVIQERRKDREDQFGAARVKIAGQVRAAEQYGKVEVTEADRNLAVARINLEAAKDRAARIRAEGFAAARVTVMRNKAEAEALKSKVSAFGSGDKYAENLLITKLAPAVTQVLSNTEGGPFAELFQRFVTRGADAAAAAPAPATAK